MCRYSAAGLYAVCAFKQPGLRSPQVDWDDLLEQLAAMLDASFPGILCMTAVIAQMGTSVLQCHIVIRYSFPGVMKLQPRLSFPKKCPVIHQRSCSFSADNYCLHVALYTTSVAPLF